VKEFYEVLFDILKVLGVTLLVGYMAWGWMVMQ
jgi:hypothetical protein